MNTIYEIEHTPVSKRIQITFEQVDNLYIGKGNNCRCGCAGVYHEASKPEDAKTIRRVLKKMTSGKYKVESIEDYIFEIVISERLNARGGVGYRKVNTLYLKRVKEVDTQETL